MSGTKTGLCSARAGEFKAGGHRLAGLHLAILAILRKFHGMSRYVQNTKGFRLFRDGADADAVRQRLSADGVAASNQNRHFVSKSITCSPQAFCDCAAGWG